MRPAPTNTCWGRWFCSGQENGSFVELGLVEQAWDFVRRNTTPTFYLDGMRRVDRWEYPESVIREGDDRFLVRLWK